MESPSATSNLERPKASFHHLLWAGLFMLCGLSVLIYLGGDRRKVLGQPVFELDLQPLANVQNALDMNKTKGKLVLLHFWGPWCPPCRKEYPEIEKLASQYADAEQVCVVSIACSDTAPDDVARLERDTLAMLGKKSAPHPIYCDPVEYSRARIAKLLGQRGFSYPTSVLLDQEGHILDYWIRPTGPGELEKSIRTALSKTGANLR